MVYEYGQFILTLTFDSKKIKNPRDSFLILKSKLEIWS